MNNIGIFHLNPLRIPSIAVSFAKQKEMATAYAEAYTDEHGESVGDYVSRIGLEVYPGHRRFLNGQRADFRCYLRSELRRLGKLGARSW